MSSATILSNGVVLSTVDGEPGAWRLHMNGFKSYVVVGPCSLEAAIFFAQAYGVGIEHGAAETEPNEKGRALN